MSLPGTMAAVLPTGHGGLEELEYRTDVPVPRPREGEVLIQVAAAAIDNTDVNTRIGWYSKAITSGTGAAEQRASTPPRTSTPHGRARLWSSRASRVGSRSGDAVDQGTPGWTCVAPRP